MYTYIYILFLNRLKTRRLLRPLAHVSLRRRGCNGTKGLRDSIIYLGGTIMNIYIYDLCMCIHIERYMLISSSTLRLVTSEPHRNGGVCHLRGGTFNSLAW